MHILHWYLCKVKAEHLELRLQFGCWIKSDPSMTVPVSDRAWSVGSFQGIGCKSWAQQTLHTPANPTSSHVTYPTSPTSPPVAYPLSPTAPLSHALQTPQAPVTYPTCADGEMLKGRIGAAETISFLIYGKFSRAASKLSELKAFLAWVSSAEEIGPIKSCKTNLRGNFLDGKTFPHKTSSSRVPAGAGGVLLLLASPFQPSQGTPPPPSQEGWLLTDLPSINKSSW